MNVYTEREEAALDAAKKLLQRMLAPLDGEARRALLTLLLAATKA